MTAPTFAAPTPDDTVQIKDFTIKKKRIKFSIDDDVFEAYAILGLPLLQDLVQSAKGMGEQIKSQKYDGIFGIFDKILEPKSATRFRKRAQSVGDDGIDVKRQLLPVLYYLLEEYGIRPTQPSLDSLTGSPSGTDGITTTVGSQPVEFSLPISPSQPS